jgi:hypothetical protein
VHEVGERASQVQIDLAAAEQLLRARIIEVGSQLGLEAAQWKETQKDTSGRLSRHDGKLEELERRVSASKVELAQLDERVEPLPAAQAALAAQLAAARAESTQACVALGKRVDQEAELSASGVRKATDELKRADSAIRELQGAAKQVEQQQAQLGARVGEVGAEIEPMKRSLASLGKAVEASDERSAKAAQATAAQIDALQVRPPCVCALALQGGRTHGMACFKRRVAQAELGCFGGSVFCRPSLTRRHVVRPSRGPPLCRHADPTRPLRPPSCAFGAQTQKRPMEREWCAAAGGGRGENG